MLITFSSAWKNAALFYRIGAALLLATIAGLLVFASPALQTARAMLYQYYGSAENAAEHLALFAYIVGGLSQLVSATAFAIGAKKGALKKSFISSVDSFALFGFFVMTLLGGVFAFMIIKAEEPMNLWNFLLSQAFNAVLAVFSLGLPGLFKLRGKGTITSFFQATIFLNLCFLFAGFNWVNFSLYISLNVLQVLLIGVEKQALNTELPGAPILESQAQA